MARLLAGNPEDLLNLKHTRESVLCDCYWSFLIWIFNHFYFFLIPEKMQRHPRPDWSSLALPLWAPEVHILVLPQQDRQKTVPLAASKHCQQKLLHT